MGVSFPPSNKAFVHVLVYFLLLLAIETLNVNDDMIFKCVKLVQILSSAVLIWVCLSHMGVSFHPAIRPFVHVLVHFLLLLAIETLNVNDDMIFKCVKLVQILSSVVLIWVCLSHPAMRPFVHFLVHFLLLLAFETVNLNVSMIFKCVKLVQILSSVVLIWVCLSHPAMRPFVHFLVHFLLLLAIETLNVNVSMIFKCVKLVQILSSVVLIWVCLYHPAIRPFVHFLVHFLLLLAIETLNMNDDMIFKCVKLVQILSSVVLIWVCLSHPAMRPFVHFLVHFLLLLAIETLNLNVSMIFKCVKLVQILSSVVLIWVCLSHPAIRPFVHVLVHFLLLLAFETLNMNDDMIFKCVKLVQILSSVVLIWVCLSHQAMRPFVHFLVHFLLLLAIETLNVNDDMIFKSVKLVQILSSVVLIWVCLSHPAIRPFVHFLVHFLLLLAIETLNMNDDMIFKCVKLVQILSSVVLIWVCLSHPAMRPFVHFLVHFLLLLAIETLNLNVSMIFKCVKLVQILSSVVLIWVCLYHPAIRPFVHFLVHFLLLLAIETLNVNVSMIFKCVKLVQILSSVVLIWVCLYHPAIRPFVHFLVHFLLLLAIETLNMNDDMIFKCVKLVQILSSVVLIWVCLSHPAMRPFVHFLVHFLLLLAIETLNVNDDMIFKCVKLVQILSSVVLIWVCLYHPAIRPFVHFLVHFLLLLAIETLNVNVSMIFKCVKLVQILSSVVLIWVCLYHPAIRPFVHFLVHFLLLLAIETLNMNDDMIFKCVKLVQILSSVVLIWVCLSHPAMRPFVHFLVHFLLLLAIETLNLNVSMIFKCVKLVQILSSVVLIWVCLSHPAIRHLFMF